MAASLMDALRVQRRVVWALMLRETKTLFGKHKLGYLWAIINAAFQIGIFWAIREFLGAKAPHGMSTAAFLLSGFIPFYIFSHAVTGGVNAVDGNRALLVYPQVYPLDIIVARTTLQGAVQSVVFVLLLCFAAIIGQNVVLENVGGILIALVSSLILGFGAGALCSALNLMQPVTSQIVPMVMRVLFFTSGLFFSVVDFPSMGRDILFFNPMCHIIELTRSGFVDGYGEGFISLPYLFGFTLTFLALGLLLERYSRSYLDRAV